MKARDDARPGASRRAAGIRERRVPGSVRAVLITLAALMLAAPAMPEKSYSPNIARERTQLYWGDLHLHTSLSADAYIMGSRITPETAYRYARGETVEAGNGMRVRPRYPLDFLAISDHAEYLAIYQLLDQNDPRVRDWPVGQEWRKMLLDGRLGELTMAFSDAFQNPTPEKMTPEKLVRSAWGDVVATADRFNRPHEFTAFPAYEWSSTIAGDNLHRVVIYRDGLGTADTRLPFTSQDSTDPEDLWEALARYESATGGAVLAIPHNGNVSNGRMFAPETLAGEPMDRRYAQQRRRWEPLLEVTQVKGDGETHPSLSPNDRYANFETWDEGNIQLTEPKEPWMLPREYARSALKLGLTHRRELGVNPFYFGMVGSTDSHTGLVAVAEDNFFGKFRTTEPSAERMFTRMAEVLNENWRLSASGLTGVWAPQNTRESLFDALRRREVYATTGSRIRLRFFGGWDYKTADLKQIGVSDIGYAKGVPMGAELPSRPEEDAAPTFMLIALKEPDGADLHAIQVVKGWVDAQGDVHERVYDLALAGAAEHAGAAALQSVWTDPAFDARNDAFYYARVIEVPRPRWTTRDAEFFGVEVPSGVPRLIQDRAYSSPIWYAASGHDEQEK